MKKLLREPLFHFLLIGALIFAVNARREGTRPAAEGLPVIEVSAGTLAWLGANLDRIQVITPGS